MTQEESGGLGQVLSKLPVLPFIFSLLVLVLSIISGSFIGILIGSCSLSFVMGIIVYVLVEG